MDIPVPHFWLPFVKTLELLLVLQGTGLLTDKPPFCLKFVVSPWLTDVFGPAFCVLTSHLPKLVLTATTEGMHRELARVGICVGVVHSVLAVPVGHLGYHR